MLQMIYLLLLNFIFHWHLIRTTKLQWPWNQNFSFFSTFRLFPSFKYVVASKKCKDMSFRLPNTWCRAFLQERIQKSENMSFRLLNTWCYAFLQERIQKSITTGYGKKTVWDLERAHPKGYLSIESRKKRQKRPKNDKNNWFSKLLK